MNKSNPLETQARSWTPRRPSPALEQRLFGPVRDRRAVRPPGAEWRPGWGWLAPVACVFVLGLQLSMPPARTTFAGRVEDRTVVATLNLGRQGVVTYSPGWAHSARNNVHGETFESTNWTAAPSSMRTLPVFLTLTNGLIQ